MMKNKKKKKVSFAAAIAMAVMSLILLGSINATARTHVGFESGSKTASLKNRK